MCKYLKQLTKNQFVTNKTQGFPSMLSNVPISKDKENVDVESLSTNIPIKDTIDFIFEEISVCKKLEPI